MAGFQPEEFLPRAAVERLTDLRISDPERAFLAAVRRKRRSGLTEDGRLNLLAADHPARRVTAAGPDPLAMARRGEFLSRILRVLVSARVDGVMATMDVLEDLLVIADVVEENGGPPILEEKLLIASLNRGGLAGTAWEMDDPVTGPSPAACDAWCLDGVKLLVRVCDDDPGSLRTLLACARAISEAVPLALASFVEPLPVERAGEGFRTVRTPEALARVAGVASALGDSSRRVWLKLPYCDGYETVAGATTLPILLLGGESAGDPLPFLREVAAGLAAAPNVRGALAGRNVLYPGTEDPLAVAEALGGIIHGRRSVDEAAGEMPAWRGRDLDSLARYLR